MNSNGPQPEPRCRTRAGLRLLLIMLLLALPVRLYLALSAAMISRDGVTFIWYAQDLAGSPITEMREQDQHPLYPALVLGAHKLIEWIGGALSAWSPGTWDVVTDPVRSWVLAGVSVTLLGGLVAVAGVYWLTTLLFDRKAGLLAAVFAALAAEWCQLSADALSDMPHLSLYLFSLCAGIQGVRALSRHAGWAWLFLSGVLSGLAFLMRPEGGEAGLVAALGALILVKGSSLRRRVLGAAAVCAGVALMASPYMLVTGKIVQKKSPAKFFSAQRPPGSVAPFGGSDDLGPASTGGSAPLHPRLLTAAPAGLRIHRAGLGMRHSALSTQHSALSTQDLVLSSQFSVLSSSDATSVVQSHATAGLRIHRSGLGMQHSVLSTQHSGLSTQDSALRTQDLALSSQFSVLSSSDGNAVGQSHATEFFRAGLIILEHWSRLLRVTLTLPPIVWLVLRRRLPAQPLAGRLVGAAALLHVAVLWRLVLSFDYWDLLSLRHLLVLGALTLPFTAAGVLALLDLVPAQRRRLAGGLILLGLIAPTLPWMLERRYTQDLHLRRAGEWIRSQQPEGARIQTTRHTVAFYANGVWHWSPRDEEGDLDRILAEARAKRPDWLVFDENRMNRTSPGYFGELEARLRPGEELTRVHTEEQFSKRTLQRAVVCRYRPPA